MKIHTDILTTADIIDAVPSGCYLAEFYNLDGERKTVDQMGSRSHGRAYVVRLSGSSKSTMQGLPDKAATWAEWGNFLATLYRRDPSIKAGHYKTLADFMRITQDEASRLGLDASWLDDANLYALAQEAGV